MKSFKVFLEDNEPALTLYHGSLDSNKNDLDYEHFGTKEAAQKRLSDIKTGLRDEPASWNYHLHNGNNPTIYKVKFRPGNSLEMKDHGEWDNEEVANSLHHSGLLSDQEHKHVVHSGGDLHQMLRDKGYHSIKYRNHFEGNGEYSYFSLHPGRAQLLGKERYDK